MTPRSTPADVWSDDRVVVGPSSISGSGLFASADIDEGTVVLRLGGRLVSTAALADLIAAADADPDAPYVDAITVDEDRHLVLPPSTVAHFANHSCDPSLWHVGPYELATRRDVSAGGELTVDYGTSSGAEGFVMPCRCGSRICRERVTSDDWRRPELRVRYAGHWTPALQRRIDNSE
jgi:SET domain-containing protein